MEIIYLIAAETEDTNPHDTLNECMEPHEIDALIKESETNEWAWCNVRVTATLIHNGTLFEGVAFLGGNAGYKSRADWEETHKDDYLPDLMDEACEDLMHNLDHCVNKLAVDAKVMLDFLNAENVPENTSPDA